MTDLFSIKSFKLFLGIIILIETASLSAYYFTDFANWIFWAIIVLAILLTWKDLTTGVLLLFGELFIGGKGYLFSYGLNDDKVSLRMALFAILIGAWIIKRLPKIIKNQLADTILQKIYLALVVVVSIGAILGFINNPVTWFNDFNAWIFFIALLPILDIFQLSNPTKKVINLMLAASTYLSFKTIILLMAFAFAPTSIVNFIYHWVRNSGVGEITHVSGTIFRIFMQSQIYTLIALMIALMITIVSWSNLKKNDKLIYFGLCYLFSLAIIISQSRSFWMGLIAGISIMILLIWQTGKLPIKKIITRSTIIILVLVSHTLTLQLLTGNFSGLVVKDRLSDVQTEAAGVSRLNQLKPLIYASGKNFLLGQGFGSQITYQSNDPRILKNNPDGLYTTYAFEWGYLDIWLKLGIVGLLIYLWLLAVLAFRTYQQKTLLSFGLLIGLVALMATHMFSPYLNHPLGISYVILLTASVNTNLATS